MSLRGQEFRVVFALYSVDGKRAVDVCEFSGGAIYLDEKEQEENKEFKNRHSGRMVGPFASAEVAEAFVTRTAWFRGVGR